MLKLREKSRRVFRVLVATDGSPAAKAALATAVRFPWPEPSLGNGVVALERGDFSLSGELRETLKLALRAVAAEAARELRRRWKSGSAVAVDNTPREAILAEAKRLRCDALVLGWRGHGAFRRILAGSVSRSIVRDSGRPVLVVRTAPAHVRRFVLGFDGSANARHALQLLLRLRPDRRSAAVVIKVIEPLRLPAAGRLPGGARASLHAELRRVHRQRESAARRTVDAAVARLRESGWHASGEVRLGAPLAALLDGAKEHRADVLVLGARAKRGAERLILGSVASGALDAAPIPVMIVP